MNRDSLSSLVPWQGETVTVRPSTETTIAISEIEVSEGGKEREEGGRERKRERERGMSHHVYLVLPYNVYIQSVIRHSSTPLG